jgi:predicted nucleotidyltransferase
MDLHDRVSAVVDAYLQAIDEEAPGLVEGLYLTGSTALGEFRPHTSDIDFLAVTAKQPTAADVAALGRAHSRLHHRRPRPFFDGRYVTWDELTRDPRQAGLGPYSYEGRFHARGRGDCDPVTWHTVARHGVRCRGPEPADLAVWTDAPTLRSWTLSNFDSYWQPLLRRARRFPDPWSVIAFTSYGAVWMVLGVCRLHYTLTTGTIGSKEEAGCHGIRTFPEQWHRVLNEALRIRRADRARPDMPSAFFEVLDDLRIRQAPDGGSLYRTPMARRRDVLAFADMVIADANDQFGC